MALIMIITGKKGFSLVEMIIVIAIIAIVSTIAVPSFNKYRHNANLKEAVRLIVADFQLAKQRAISQNTNFSVTLNPAANTYTIQGGTLNITKSISAISSAVRISNGANPFAHPAPTLAANMVTYNARGISNLGTFHMQNDINGSWARISTTITGRINVRYNLQ